MSNPPPSAAKCYEEVSDMLVNACSSLGMSHRFIQSFHKLAVNDPGKVIAGNLQVATFGTALILLKNIIDGQKKVHSLERLLEQCKAEKLLPEILQNEYVSKRKAIKAKYADDIGRLSGNVYGHRTTMDDPLHFIRDSELEYEEGNGVSNCLKSQG